MDTETKKVLLDMHAFIQWCLKNNAERLIVPTLNHDLAGLLNQEPGFAPRSSGYYKIKRGPFVPKELA